MHPLLAAGRADRHSWRGHPFGAQAGRDVCWPISRSHLIDDRYTSGRGAVVLVHLRLHRFQSVCDLSALLVKEVSHGGILFTSVDVLSVTSHCRRYLTLVLFAFPSR